MHMAVVNKHSEIVAVLLEAGARVDLIDRGGRTGNRLYYCGCDVWLEYLNYPLAMI